MTKKTRCPLCGSHKASDYKVLFPANFRMAMVPKLFSARRLPDKIHYQLVKCQKDGMVRSNPILDTRTLDKLYKFSAFTYQKEVENLVITYMNALRPALKKIKKNDRILEIGCGSGFMLAALHKEGFSRVYGAEPSKEAVSKADKEIGKKIVNKPFTAKLFKPSSFDFIFFLQTLDHIPDPNKFLSECRKILKPGGYILSFHHNVESFSARLLGERSPIFDIEHTHLYSFATTQAIFTKEKMNVVRIYSPLNTLSIAHFMWLLPIPPKLKQFSTILRLSFTIPLGNICIIARKAAQ